MRPWAQLRVVVLPAEQDGDLAPACGEVDPPEDLFDAGCLPGGADGVPHLAQAEAGRMLRHRASLPFLHGVEERRAGGSATR